MIGGKGNYYIVMGARIGIAKGARLGNTKFIYKFHFSRHRIENIRSCSSSNHGPVNEPFPLFEYAFPGAKILTPRKCVSFPF
jgi:hypothetical protein